MHAAIGRGEITRKLFWATLIVAASASALSVLLAALFGMPQPDGRVSLPPALYLSTVMLVIGSGLLQFAEGRVRLEKQRPFRRALTAALAAGTVFVGIQAYGICCLFHKQPADISAQTDAHAFTFVFVALHAMHFVVALWFLTWVTLNAHYQRYDHEYYWGVTVCTWFWHVLGIVWLAILAVFAIAI